MVTTNANDPQSGLSDEQIARSMGLTVSHHDQHGYAIVTGRPTHFQQPSRATSQQPSRTTSRQLRNSSVSLGRRSFPPQVPNVYQSRLSASDAQTVQNMGMTVTYADQSGNNIGITGMPTHFQRLFYY